MNDGVNASGFAAMALMMRATGLRLAEAGYGHAKAGQNAPSESSVGLIRDW